MCVCVCVFMYTSFRLFIIRGTDIQNWPFSERFRTRNLKRFGMCTMQLYTVNLQRPATQQGVPLFGAPRPERPSAPANPGEIDRLR